MAAARAPIGNPWIGLAPAILLVALFFLAPLANILRLSLETPDGLGLGNYSAFFTNPTMTAALLRSLLLAVSVTALSTVIAYPLAYFLALVVRPGWRMPLLLLLIAPFWTSFTIRAFSWQLVLADSGLLAHGLGVFASDPVAPGILYTFAASILGLSLFGVMLMTLLLCSAMVGIDRRLIEASSALGARPFATFREVVLPLSLPGYTAAAVLVFILSIGDYAVPTLLGGGFRPVLAQLLVSVLKGTYDLPQAAAMAGVLMLVVMLAALPLGLVAGRRASR